MEFLPPENLPENENLEVKTGGINDLPKRLKRYAKAKQQTLSIYPHIVERIKSPTISMSYQIHLQKILKDIEKCADYLLFHHYYTVDEVRLIGGATCHKHQLCQFCAIRRGSKLLQKYIERYEHIMTEQPDLKLSMVTFTVKNGDDFEERYKHIKKSIKKLLQHRRDTLSGVRGYTSEFAKAEGLVGAYETTNKGNGYHVHMHMMVLHRRAFNYKALQAEWKKITGDSHVVNITPAKHPENPAKDFIEVFKYFVKFGDLTPEQILDIYQVLRGQRQIVSAGLFYGVKIPEKLTDDKLENLPYYQLIYNHVIGSGYNLVRSEHKK